jgi:hypothetical protein
MDYTGVGPYDDGGSPAGQSEIGQPWSNQSGAPSRRRYSIGATERFRRLGGTGVNRRNLDAVRWPTNAHVRCMGFPATTRINRTCVNGRFMAGSDYGGAREF